MLEPYSDSVKNVGSSYGLDLEISIKNKEIKSPVESVFTKLNIYQTFINLKIKNEIVNLVHKDEKIKVKFEIDTNPSLGFNIESRWIDTLEFTSVSVLDDSNDFFR